MKATTLLFGAAAALAIVPASVAQTSPTGNVRLAQASPPSGAQPATPPAQGAPAAQPAPSAPAVQPSSPPPAAAQPAPSQPAPAPPAPPAKLTGLAAWTTLVGNTVTGKLDGKEYADYYLADGTVKSMVESQIVSGKWALEGEKICFIYPGDPKECYALEVVGDAATFTDTAGVGIRGQILKGNAKNL